MELNAVHGTQMAYREIVQSMARPGESFTLQNNGIRMMEHLACFDATATVIYTLLDSSVTYHVPTNDQQMIQLISTYTQARHGRIEEADFVICPANMPEQLLIDCFEKCSIGTLTDPHLSATFILEQKMEEAFHPFTITGPGVKDENHLYTCFSEAIWKTRAARLKEFPLGFDVILVQENGEIISVPRTSTVQRMVSN